MQARTDTYTQEERVKERSSRLYEDGYRAAPMPGAEECYILITPGGDQYTLDPVAQSCNCAFFPYHGFCKHSLGLVQLLKSQLRAREARRELRQQAGAAPVTAADPGPAPQPVAPRPRPGRRLSDFGASPAEARQQAQH